MAGQSGVSLADLLKTAQGQEEALVSAKGQLEQVTSHGEALMGGWKGAAATEYQNALHNFLQNGENVLNALQEMHNAMSNTHNVFANTHQNTISASQRAAAATSQATGIPGL